MGIGDDRLSEWIGKRSMDHWWDLVLDHDGQIINDPRKPGVPPRFFAMQASGQSIDSVTDASSIMRTSTFAAGPTPIPIQRRVYGSDSLVAWLNTMPYDTDLDMPADVLFITELVRASDDAILWQGDTVTARSVADSSNIDIVNVPVQLYAALDTNVYIRLRTVTTEGLDYDLSAGFSFVDGDTTSGLLWKRSRPRDDIKLNAVPESSLSAEVIPNPARDKAELQLHVTNPGTVRISIHNMLGGLMESLPPFEVRQSGDYSRELDLSGLRSGVLTSL